MSKFFNTTSESGSTLSRFKQINSGQDATILNFFKRRSRSKMTPYDVKRSGILNRRTPIDSIRRSINTLTELNHLVKLDEKRTETLGRPNHLWKLKTA